jgi:predicted MFS family arabinose efflux permease
VTASLTPWIAGRFGWTASFLVAAALCVVGALAWLLVDPSRSLAPREKDVVIARHATDTVAHAARNVGMKHRS